MGAVTNLAHATSYFGYESFGGTWYDANKTLGNTLDDPYCTVGAASNVLMYTGWNAGFNNEADVFNEFLDLWGTSNLSNELTLRNSLSLWLNGTYRYWTNWPTSYEDRVDTSGNGDFYPDDLFSDYFHIETNQSNVLSAADDFLHNRYGVALTIQVPNNIMQHTITLWGYDYDTAGNYTGIWISDSDDYYPDPNTPQPTLSYYGIHYNQSLQNWWLDGYHVATLPQWGNSFYIQSISALATNPAVVPEPVSAALFLVGGATFGFRRFRKKITI